MKSALVTQLKRQSTQVLAELHTTKEPVLITEHGKPSAYLLDVDDYEGMQNRLRLLVALARGERAISEGRLVSNEAAKQRLAKWLK